MKCIRLFLGIWFILGSSICFSGFFPFFEESEFSYEGTFEMIKQSVLPELSGVHNQIAETREALANASSDKERNKLLIQLVGFEEGKRGSTLSQTFSVQFNDTCFHSKSETMNETRAKIWRETREEFGSGMYSDHGSLREVYVDRSKMVRATRWGRDNATNHVFIDLPPENRDLEWFRTEIYGYTGIGILHRLNEKVGENFEAASLLTSPDAEGGEAGGKTLSFTGEPGWGTTSWVFDSEENLLRWSVEYNGALNHQVLFEQYSQQSGLPTIIKESRFNTQTEKEKYSMRWHFTSAGTDSAGICPDSLIYEKGWRVNDNRFGNQVRYTLESDKLLPDAEVELLELEQRERPIFVFLDNLFVELIRMVFPSAV